jgi:hypothetical protein
MITHAGLEQRQVVLGEGIGLGNDGYQVDASAQAFHDLNVQRLEPAGHGKLASSCVVHGKRNKDKNNLHSRVSGWPDEEQACVDPEVNLALSLGLLLLPHVELMLVVDKVDDGRPRVAVVDIVTESRCVDHGEFNLKRLLFELCLDDLHLQDS